MKGRYGDKLNSAHEGREDVLEDDKKQVPRGDPLLGEDHHDPLCEHCRRQSADERPAPQVHGRVFVGPLPGVVAKSYLEREVDKHGQSQVLLAEAFLEQLQVRDAFVGLEADLGDQVQHDEGLDVLELKDLPHELVHLGDAIPNRRLVLSLEKAEPEGDEQVGPAPEGQVPAEGDQSLWLVRAPEPAVCKIFGVERQEDGMG